MMHSDSWRDGDPTLARSDYPGWCKTAEPLFEPIFQRYIFLLSLCPSAVGVGKACQGLDRMSKVCQTGALSSRAWFPLE